MDIRDPLRNAGPGNQFELFKAFERQCNGASTDIVIGAAASLMVNAVRQEYDTGPMAEKVFDELYGKMKSLLMSHYNSFGRKIEVSAFPVTPGTPGFINQIMRNQ